MPQEPFLGQLALYPYPFVPKGWAICAGQILQIQQYSALFSLLGTQFGGDGRVTFGLPNLQGRTPLGMGTNPNFVMGQTAGEEAHTLIATEVPQHLHSLEGSTANASSGTSANNLLGVTTAQNYGTGASVAMNPASVTVAGGSIPHENRTPYLVIAWCIALIGIFPSRS